MDVYTNREQVAKFEARLAQALHSTVEVGDFLKGEWSAGASIRLPQSGDGGRVRDYARQGHPGGEKVEHLIKALELGAHALCYSDGMRAIASATQSVVKPGDLVLAHQALYGGSIRFLNRLSEWGVTVQFADLSQEEAGSTILEGKPKLIFLESVSNPKMQILDLPALMRAAQRVGSAMIVDNTLPTAWGCVPLDMARHCGYERLMVALSLTKGYTAGELGGAIVTDNEELAELLYKTRQAEGGNASTRDVPHFYEAMKSMGLRMERLGANATALATYFDNAKVEGITPISPVLESHPDHARARDMLLRDPGLLTLDCHLPEAQFRLLVDELETAFLRSNSFNGHLGQLSESAVQSHGSVKDMAQRETAGAARQLLRISPSSTWSPHDLVERVKDQIGRWAAKISG